MLTGQLVLKKMTLLRRNIRIVSTRDIKLAKSKRDTVGIMCFVIRAEFHGTMIARTEKMGDCENYYRIFAWSKINHKQVIFDFVTEAEALRISNMSRVYRIDAIELVG